jgi:hypothetical protein
MACLALWPAPLLAQESPAMTNLTISLWPEYDEPALLVIYRGQFAGDVSSPLPVEFRIPAEAGKPQAVAYLNELGDLLTLEYTTRAEGDWLVIAFELPTRDFQLEYYGPLPGSPAPGQRTFTYTYSADYAVATLELKVQEPLGAQGMKLEPAADSVIEDADGLNYHLTTAGPLKQGDTATWSVSYDKTDSGLTIGASASEPTETPAAAVSPTAPGENRAVSGILVASVGLIVLAAVGAGAFWLGKRTQPAPLPAAPNKRRRGGQKGQAKGPRPAQSTMQDTGFCYKCGARLRPGTDFCHQCGAAVRKS